MALANVSRSPSTTSPSIVELPSQPPAQRPAQTAASSRHREHGDLRDAFHNHDPVHLSANKLGKMTPEAVMDLLEDLLKEVRALNDAINKLKAENGEQAKQIKELKSANSQEVKALSDEINELKSANSRQKEKQKRVDSKGKRKECLCCYSPPDHHKPVACWPWKYSTGLATGLTIGSVTGLVLTALCLAL